jgi:hypothetical protein
VDGSKTGGQYKAVAGGIRTRSYTSVATQRCQLYHYNVVLIQLAALRSYKRVAAGLKPVYKLRNTGPQFCYCLLDSSCPRGLGLIP